MVTVAEKHPARFMSDAEISQLCGGEERGIVFHKLSYFIVT